MIEFIKRNEKLTQILLPVWQLVKYGACGPVYKWPMKSVIKLDLNEYKLGHGKKCNFDTPTLFTEKIQRYKYLYENKDINRITDKVSFKEYIKGRLGDGHVIPMIGAWDNVEDFEKEWFKEDSIIPEEFVLKSNLQGNGLCIKIIHKKSETNFDDIKDEIASWLDVKNTLMNSISRHLYWSKPMILAEQYMSNFKDQLYDYKFFCFSGKIFCIYVAQDHFGQDGSHISFYDIAWNKLDVQYGNHPVGDAVKPKHYEEMIELAKKLSRDFPFVRVDFFDTDDKLYIAELTFDPGGGLTPYHPESFNKKLGDQFILPV